MTQDIHTGKTSRRAFVTSAAAAKWPHLCTQMGNQYHAGVYRYDLVTASKKGGPWLLENRRIAK